jgi:hypothetical protein
VPSSLSPEQDEAIDRLSSVMNGNPRATLFSQAGTDSTSGTEA